MYKSGMGKGCSKAWRMLSTVTDPFQLLLKQKDFVHSLFYLPVNLGARLSPTVSKSPSPLLATLERLP